MDFRDVDRPTAANATHTTVTQTTATHTRKWEEYPLSKFGNWTQTQIEHSQMLAKCSKKGSSTIYWMDVRDGGKFTTPNVTKGSHITTVTNAHPERFWDILQEKVNLTCHLCPRLGR